MNSVAIFTLRSFIFHFPAKPSERLVEQIQSERGKQDGRELGDDHDVDVARMAFGTEQARIAPVTPLHERLHPYVLQ